MENAEQVLEAINVITGVVGGDNVEGIAEATEMLLEISGWVSGIGAELQGLLDDVERLNKRNQELQIANSKAMRQINTQKEVMEEANERVTISSELAQMF